jgi:hypothetical protein
MIEIIKHITQILNDYSGLLSLIAAIAGVASYIVAKRGERNARKSKIAELETIEEFDREDPRFSSIMKNQPDFAMRLRKRQLEKELKK